MTWNELKKDIDALIRRKKRLKELEEKFEKEYFFNYGGWKKYLEQKNKDLPQ